IMLFQFYFSHGRNIRGNLYVPKQLFCNSPGNNPGCSFARRGTPTAAVVAGSVFFIIGKIGVRGAINVFNMAVILAFLIGIFNYKANWPARCFSLKNSRKKFYFIFLFALGNNFGL